jgi:predicted anti-sigma-YlaC factor YlaD/sugar lactone lactonase YvrE
MHLSDELLSAYLDGELAPIDAVAAAAHLRTCAGCAQTARLYAALDDRLTSTPALDCSAALTLLSAELDGELGAEESTIATTHLATCAACRSDILRWSVADQAIAAFPPARPSARVDAAIAALGRAPAGRRLPRIAWPARALAVATVVALVLALNLSFGPSAPGPLVAAIQQSVLDPVTGTLYVLNSEKGTVAALDALTLQERTVITIGGRPTALALNATTNTILVLDATARTVTEIDCASNAVTSSTSVSFPGTPTSLQVDPSGKLVVTSVVAAPVSNPAAITPIAPAGIVSVFDGGTKQLQTVKSVDVAPSQVVWQPNGKRALLVSADATTLVDTGTYQPLARFGGGIAAAFSSGGSFAILSSSKDGAVVTRQSGSPTVVGGKAQAIAALPDGGFAVLSDAAGRGHIFVLNADGIVTSTLDVAPGGRDLAYDATTKQLALVGAAGLMTVALPAVPVVVQAPPPTDTRTAPTVSAPPAAVDATKPTPGAAAVTPAQPSAPTVAVVAPSQGLVPTDARAVWPGTYLVQLSLQPRLATSDRDRIWMLDTQNRLSALHTKSGELYTQLAQLPTSASIARIVTSPNHVYLTDPTAGLIYVFAIDTERLSIVQAPFLPIANDIVGSPDDRLWIGTTGLGLLSLDPKTQKIETTDAEPSVSAVATDPRGRVWMGVGSRQVVAVYDPLTLKFAELNLPHEGVVSAIAIDGSGTAWVGTDTGQLFAIRNEQLGAAGALGRPIDHLVVDGKGQAWYVARSQSEVLYGLANGAGLTQHALRSASGPLFDALGRAWQTDGATSGVYVTIVPGTQP